MYALPQHQELAIKSFYNINTDVKISTKKKGTQSENEDGTNSFGVHSQIHRFDKTFFIYSKNIDR